MKKFTTECIMDVQTGKTLKLKFAAYLFSALTLLNPIAPAVANMLEDVTVERDLNSNPLYLKLTDSSYQFAAPQFIEWPSSGTKSLESVYQQLLREHSSAISPPTYIPIGVSGITTFIPTYTTYKYVGTPAVQARYVRTQITALLGRNIFKYTSEAEQLNALYDNAILYAKESGVQYGAPLFLDQVSSGLARDMIWPELREINGQNVIVPVVYLTAGTVEQYKVVKAEQQIPKTTQFGSLTVYNSDLKAERNIFLDVAGNLRLSNGSLTSSGALKITALGTFDNASSVVSANGNLEVGAKNIHNRTIVYRYDLGHEQGTRYGEIASIKSTNGDVILKSHSDIQFSGADASAGNGSLTLAANGHILIGTQQIYNSSTSRYGNGTQTRSQVSYLQSHLTAEDTIKLIASGQIVIEAAELASDSGHIELLSGLGVSILDAQGATQYQASGKFGKTTVNESAYLTVAMRAVLDAGKGIKIHSDVGDISLRAADISSVDGTSISASAGKVNLLISTIHDHYNYQSVRQGSLTVKTRSHGHNITTGIPNSIVGGLAVEAVAGLNVEYTGDRNKSFEDQINDFKLMPELKWIADLKDQNSLEINWGEVEQQYESWKESSTSLSPAAIALIAIIVVVATGGAAAALGELAAASATGATASAVSAAVSAGVTAMAVQTAVITANAFVGGEYNPYEIQKDIHSKETLQTVATAMVTAAALSYLDSAFFEDLEVNKLAEQQGVDPSTIDTGLLRDAKGQLNFVGQATQVTAKAAVGSFVEVLAQGDSLSEFGGNFHNAFESTLKRFAVDSLGEATYQGIAGAQFNTAVEYIALAGAGCVFGAAVGNGSNDRGNCYSGAGGAVVGKYLGDKASEGDITPAQRQEMLQQQKEWLSGNGVKSAAEWAELQDTNPENYLKLTRSFNRYRLSSVRSLQQSGVDIARMTAGLLALVAGGNVDVAANQASVSAANSAKVSQKLAVLNAIDVLSDYQNLKPLLDLQELLVGADTPEKVVRIFEGLVQQYPEYGYLLSMPVTDALALMQQVALDSGYVREFPQLLAARLSLVADIDGEVDYFVGDFLDPASSDKRGYWVLKEMSMDPMAKADIAARIDDEFADRFGVSDCGAIGACVEASTLMKALLFLSGASDLESAAQKYYDQNRPLIEASGDPDLLHAYDATFAYFSNVAELVVEVGASHAALVEMGTASLAVLTGMAAYVATDGRNGQFEYTYGYKTLIETAETTAYLATMYDKLPGVIKQSVDEYFVQIDAAEAAGDVLLAEKLKSKPFIILGAVLLTGGRNVGAVIPNRFPVSYFDDLASKATRNPDSDKLVLGRGFEDGKSYTKVAAHYEATYFKLDNWSDLSRLMTPDEIWRINESFLDQQLKAGKQIILSHDPATASRFYLREVQYLEDLGYKFVQDGWVWRAVK